MKRNFLTLVIGAVLIIIFALLLFVFQVRQSETAVITTFGKPDAKPITEPGAYFKWPWPIQKVYKYDERVQNFEDKYSQSLTTNGVTILTSVYVGWKISDAGTFIQKFPGDPSVSVPNVQTQLEGILRTAKSAVIGQHPLSNLVNADPQELKFDAIEKEIEASVQSQLQGKNYGIELEFLGFKKIGLPESVTSAVFQRMTQERQVKINELVYDGEKQATIIKSVADRHAADTLSQANAAATRIEGEGVAEAAKTLPVFQQNPQLATFLLSINALQQSLNQRSTLIFDERTPPFNLFQNLPTNSPVPQP